MITLPEHVFKEDSWDGVDPDNGFDNLESSMDWAEHQRIVCSAKGLLQGEPPHTGVVKELFTELKNAFCTNGISVVRVSKGIHQPGYDPHLQLRITTTWSAANSREKKFHLNVSATAIAATDNLADDLFQWQPVQFTLVHNSLIYAWPTLAVAIEKKGILKRRLSISAVDLKAHIATQLKLKREAAQEVLKKSFDEVIAAFHEEHGGRAKLVRHSNPEKNGVFPNKNFQGGSNATVIISNKQTIIHYDAAATKIVFGQKSK